MESVSTHSWLTHIACRGDPPYHGVFLIDEEQRELLCRDATVAKIQLLSDQHEQEVSSTLIQCDQPAALAGKPSTYRARQAPWDTQAIFSATTCPEVLNGEIL